jgi:hypothetical protein
MWEAIKEYFLSFGRWGWVVTVFIVGDAYGLVRSLTEAANQQFVMPLWAWLLILVLILVITPFIPFHKMKIERDKLRRKPKPKLEIVDKPYTDKRPLYHESGLVIAQPFCANLRFRNSPEIRTSETNANKVYAETTFYDMNLKEILKVDKLRTSDIPEPSRQLGIPERQYYEVEFNANGNPREYTIAIKHEEDADCYAFSDHNYFYPKWRKPEYILQGDKFYVRVNLKGENAEGEFWFILCNYGIGKNIELEIKT